MLYEVITVRLRRAFGFGATGEFDPFLLFISIFRSAEDPGAQAAAPLNFREAFGDVLHDRPFWHFTVVATLIS